MGYKRGPVKIGDLEENSEAIKVVRPKFDNELDAPWRCTRFAAPSSNASNVRLAPKWKQQGQDVVEDKRWQGKRRRVLPPGQRADAWKAGRGLARIVVAFTCRSQHSLWLKRSESGSVGRRWLPPRSRS